MLGFFECFGNLENIEIFHSVQVIPALIPPESLIIALKIKQQLNK